jgi:hypothetical protein
MRILVLAALATMIGIGAARVEPVGDAPVSFQEDATASWANG